MSKHDNTLSIIHAGGRRTIFVFDHSPETQKTVISGMISLLVLFNIPCNNDLISCHRTKMECTQFKQTQALRSSLHFQANGHRSDHGTNETAQHSDCCSFQ